MMSLLWLITTALGIAMLYEQSYDVRRPTSYRLRSTLHICSLIWVACLAWTAIWWVLK